MGFFLPNSSSSTSPFLCTFLIVFKIVSAAVRVLAVSLYFNRWSLSHVFGILGVITLQIVSRLLSFTAFLSIRLRHSLITSARSIQSATFMLWAIVVSHRYWYCSSYAASLKISHMRRCILSQKAFGVSIIVMVLGYFGPLALRHSFQRSAKVLKDECRYRYCHRPRRTTRNAPALLESLWGVEQVSLSVRC